MTPRGVEHALVGLTDIPPERVEKPMTPRGVEHSVTGTWRYSGYNVEKPMTPRGVEHGRRRITTVHPRSGEADDAERR